MSIHCYLLNLFLSSFGCRPLPYSTTSDGLEQPTSNLDLMSFDVVLLSHLWSTLGLLLQQPSSPPFATHSSNTSCPSPLPLSTHLNDVPKLDVRNYPGVSFRVI